MGWTPTLTTLVLALGAAFWARSKSTKKAEPGVVRYVPYTAILFVALTVVLLMVAHIVTLAGMHRPA